MFYYFFLGVFIILLFLFCFQIRKEMEKKACFGHSIASSRELDIKKNAEKVRIIFLGDTGTGDESQKAIAKACEKIVEERECDFVVLLGDNFIQEGVRDCDDPQFRDKFEDMYSFNLPFYAILGNHDLRGNWRAQIEYTNRSERWMMPAVNYSFEGGPVYFQAINTSCTFNSLLNLFGKKEKPWKILLGHRPMVSSGRHPGMSIIERLFIAYSGFDFVFSGHNHLLEHIQYKGVEQFVSGAGGSCTTDAYPPKNMKEAQLKFLYHGHGYIYAEFTSDVATIEFLDESNKSLYIYKRKKE